MYTSLQSYYRNIPGQTHKVLEGRDIQYIPSDLGMPRDPRGKLKEVTEEKGELVCFALPAATNTQNPENGKSSHKYLCFQKLQFSITE